jgi:MFS family permease
MLSRPALFAPFATGGFPGLWISASTGSFARVITQLAFSWIALEATGSPFLVGVVAATRMVPQLLLGIPSGALADWVDRRLMVMAVNGASVVALVLVIPLLHFDLLTPAVLIVVAALFGVLDTMRAASTQSYAYDLVRTTRATSGMAMMNLGVQMLSMIGGLVGGYALDRFGPAVTFGVTAGAMLVAALAPALGHRPPIDEPPSTACLVEASRPTARLDTKPHPKPAVVVQTRKRTRPDVAGATSLLLRNPVLATLAVAIILAEIFGFATQTLLPTFARDVFDVGAAGLGTMMALRAGGGALGLLLLAFIGAEGRSGRLFVAGATTFGLTLVLFSLASGYHEALVLLALSGMCASVMDTLGQTLMQRNAGEHERGAAMGLWVFSIGFGPIGHLTLGAGATAFGAPITMTVSGSLLMTVGLLLGLNRRLRGAR